MTTQAAKLRKCNTSDINARDMTTLIWEHASAFETCESAHFDLDNDDDEHVSISVMDGHAI